MSGMTTAVSSGSFAPLNRQEKRRSLSVRVGILVVLLVVWYALTVTEKVSPFFLPRPDRVFLTFVDIVSSGEAFRDLSVTLLEFVIAAPIAIIVGTLTGYLICLTRYSERIFEPIVASLYAIPIIIFYPISVMVLGIGPPSKIAHGALFGFFPICLSTIQGFNSVDPLYLKFARSTGASGAQVLRRIMLPAAAPTILAGYRMGLMLCFLAIIGGETIASLEGVGHRIVWYAEGMQTTQMFAYIVFVILVAVCMNTLLSMLEKRRVHS